VHAADPLLALPAPRTQADRLDTWSSRHRRFIMSVLVLRPEINDNEVGQGYDR